MREEVSTVSLLLLKYCAANQEWFILQLLEKLGDSSSIV